MRRISIGLTVMARLCADAAGFVPAWYTIDTIAGSSSVGDGGAALAAAALLNTPYGIASPTQATIGACRPRGRYHNNG